MVKTANPTTYSAVGQTITYTYKVANSGNVTLAGPFSISDNKLGTISPCGSGPLAPGASTTCTATHTIVQADLDAGSITNIATASTTYNGNPVTSNPATATVTGTQAPALSLVKTANPTTYSAVGQTITYTYVVKNTGNVTLAGPFTVTDNKLGTIACGTASLAPGGSTTCTATHTITQADLDAGSITNIATATSGNGTKSNQATATVTGAQLPALTLVKTPNPTTYNAVGQTITYTYTITNSGNVTLPGPFSISDNKLGTISPCGSGPLPPGGSTTCAATYTVTQADLTNGSITNIATASGNGVTSNQATATVTATVPLCSSKSSNAANFNGTAVGYNSGKNYIWFNSNFTVSGQGSTTAHVYFQNSTIQFTDSGTGKNYSLAVPSAAITFSPTATCASTSYDPVAQQWNTTVPIAGDDEIFLSGLAVPVPTVGISGGIKNVTWQGTFSTDAPGLSLSWKWGAAVYNNFTTNYAALGVKAAHNVACGPHNGDHAGTPENFAIPTNVIGGGTGGGSSNFTGSWSGTQKVTPACAGGPITTVTQGGWGTAPHGGNPGALLAANFMNVYGTAGVTIGVGRTLTFTSATAIQAFLPQGGTPGVLTASAINPTSSSAQVFGGQVLALELNVDFSNAGVTGSGLGSLHVQSGPLQGDTVQQVLALANSVIGGGALPAGLTVSDLNNVVDNINQSFDSGSGTGYVK